MLQDDVTATTTTDAAIRAMFERRARSDGADGLRASILVTTRNQRQHRRWYAAVQSVLPTGLTRVSVLALIALAAIASVLVGSGALPDDVVQRSTVEAFVRPFDVVMPADGGIRLKSRPASHMVAWVSGPDRPWPSDTVNAGQQPSPADRRGIIVGSAAEGAWSHGGGGRFILKTEPRAFLDDLRDIAGVEMSDITEVSLGGRPALTVMLSGAGGIDIHTSGSSTGVSTGNYALLSNPSRLTVADVDGVTVFVMAWAWTAEDLDAWLPEADAFVDTFQFLEEHQR